MKNLKMEAAVAKKNFGGVVTGKTYTIIFEDGTDSDGEQNVAVYNRQTGKHICRMRASSFDLKS